MRTSSLVRLSLSLGIVAAWPSYPRPSLVADLRQTMPIPYTELVETHGESISPEVEKKLIHAHRIAAAVYCSVNSGQKNDAERGDYVRCYTNACTSLRREKLVIHTRFHHLGTADATGFVAFDHARKKVVIAFRGSASLENDFADTEFILRPSQDICPSCQVVRGFDIYWKSAKETVEAAVRAALAMQPIYQLEVVGHSLGGAVATICAGYLRNQGFITDLYSFSSPRVGDDDFAKHVSDAHPALGANYRVTHIDDWVPKVPPYPEYHHIKDEYFISSGSYKPVKPEDIHVLRGSQFEDYRGGNGITKTTDFTFTAHSWLWDNITECSPAPLGLDKRAMLDLPASWYDKVPAEETWDHHWGLQEVWEENPASMSSIMGRELKDLDKWHYEVDKGRQQGPGSVWENRPWAMQSKSWMLDHYPDEDSPTYMPEWAKKTGLELMGPP